MQLRDAYDSIMTTIARLRRLYPFGPARGVAIRYIIEELRAAGAISRQSAQRFRATTNEEARAFAWLLELEILRQPEPGRYYLDEQVLTARNSSRFFE